MKLHTIVRIETFQEGDQYVGICPDLDVSSFGDTVEGARQSVREAVAAFLEECEAMGTLEEVLEEAGFVRQGINWVPRQPISAELIAIA